MSKGDDAASRAEIPPMLSQKQQDARIHTPQYLQRWGERQVEGATSLLEEKEIEEFLTDFAWLKETEVALQCLFDGNFDFIKAMQLLHAARRERHKRQRDRDEQLDFETFENAIENNGKKFHLVKQALGTTTREAVSNYYLWKRTKEFRKWQRCQTVKKCKKKKRETERLRLGNELDGGPETGAFRGYHNKQCELCATGGKLLCCDGCARSYHFSCVQPPITKLRRGDDEWFCPYCQEAFGGAKPKMMPSQDNEYCQVCLPFAGVPRTLVESVTDSSSQEEDDELAENSVANSNDNDTCLGWNDEVSDHVANSSDVSSTEKMILNTGYPGSLRANDASTFFPIADSTKSRNQEPKPTPAIGSSVRAEQRGTVVQSTSGLSQVTSNNFIERVVIANCGGMKRGSVLSEKTISGRKRHRKTMTPRRIPPSRFDKPSTKHGMSGFAALSNRIHVKDSPQTSDAAARAEIPALLSIEQQQQDTRRYVPQYQQRWGWQDDQRPRLTPHEITEFVQTYAWPKETELALQCLFEAGYDVSRAVEIIHEARRQHLRLNREETERIRTDNFEKAMDRHGKKFHLVKRRLGRNVTTKQLVSKFYLWKVTSEYEKWHDGQREKKRKREAKRLQQLHPVMDQHREYCEVCLKDGKLLCCDGCDRACHLNCVRPALLDVPEGEWFCSHCRDVAPKSAGSDALAPTSKSKTKTNGASLQEGSDLQLVCYVRDIEKKMGEKCSLTIKTCPDKTEPTLSSKLEDISDRFITEDLDGISDITTESESDGGLAKVFQSPLSNYVVTEPLKKRKQKRSKRETSVVRPRCKSASSILESSGQIKDFREEVLPLRRQTFVKNQAIVGQSCYSAPALSLEYCSIQVKPVFKEVKPLQLMTASSIRKRKRQADALCDNSRFFAVREVRHTESVCLR